ncbi:hypothetical protein [Campylobacter lari]|uniref:hypothetical protein n=1 Tax=Campylobacter lari TaxID=201 RepID=UPI002011549E|nr:hypothetical protein [Campylobacter lari]QEL06425.1 hypothetical protein CLCT_0312 [Campylobacter lari subsp. concheus]
MVNNLLEQIYNRNLYKSFKIDNLLQENQKLNQEKNNLLQENQKLNQEKNNLLQENQKLNQEKNNLLQENQKLNQEKNNLKIILNSYDIQEKKLRILNLEQDIVYKKLKIKLKEQKINKPKPIIKRMQIIYSQSAIFRIQNQLSYKLGQAMIVNSKSILGYIRMLFVLSYIKDKHKQEQKIYQEKIKKDPSLKLPPLEDYLDYQEALKEKECFTYKLGQALIQANKTWYKGGYIRLLLEIRKLRKDV